MAKQLGITEANLEIIRENVTDYKKNFKNICFTLNLRYVSDCIYVSKLVT